MSVRELKAGMKGTATITTRTTVTPVTVTEVKNGTVVRAFRSNHHRANRRGSPEFHARGRGQARREDHARRQARAGVGFP